MSAVGSRAASGVVPGDGPLPQSYQVLPFALYAGEYPGAPTESAAREKIGALLDAGIRVVVDLTEAGERTARGPLVPYAALLEELAAERGVTAEYHRRPIRDQGVPRTAEEMDAVVGLLERAVAEGRPAYVHCWGGVGRTGTAVACLLAMRGLDGDAALATLARLFARMPKSEWRVAPENDVQRDFVRRWAARAVERRRAGSGSAPAPDGATGDDRRAMAARTSPPDVADRVRGVLLGLAAGDALGTTLEFTTPGAFEPIGDMVGGGPFGLAAGQWTDDTSMAMCLAEALLDGGDAWPLDAMRRFVRWYREGEWSSTGTCFDIGNATRGALHRFERDGHPFAGSADPRQAGNGSLMRVGPVALRWRDDWERAVEMAAVSSRLTHAAPEAVDACRYFVGLLVGALAGESRDRLLGGAPYAPVPGYWERTGIAPAVARIAGGSFREKPATAIRASGWVVHTLEAALWAAWHADDFRGGALAAVNLGEDADTTGAVYGQLAGALFGASGIPAAWLERLALRERIEAVAAVAVLRWPMSFTPLDHHDGRNPTERGADDDGRQAAGHDG